MSAKIVTDTSVYTAATRTLSGCDAMLPSGFAASDVGRTVVFSDANTIYTGRIASVVSASSITFHPSPNLPPGNIASVGAGLVYMLDQGEVHTFGDYIARVRTLVQDDIDKLTDDEYKQLLAAAVTDYGEDMPQYRSFKIAGNGTGSYLASTVFGAYWQYGHTYLNTIEYPVGNTPITTIDMNKVRLYDDGTAQDGSNVVIFFDEYAPGATEFFNVVARVMPRLPEAGAATLPDTDSNFNNVTLLATAYACFALASAYALSTDSNIVGDVVNYGDKVDKYLRLGRTYLERYNISVFGAENPPTTAAAATVTLNLERRASDRGSFLWH